MTLRYKVTFLDYWHLGSGLSAGAKSDSTVTKDADNTPYVSGKTIKGMVREMAEELNDEAFIKECFGGEGVTMGRCYFSNAIILEDEKEQIISNKLQDNLYETIASTKIENGIAVDNSLREIEVVIPITLYAEIRDVPKEFMDKMKQSLKLIKRMGLNRNRGLGRCEFILIGER